MQFDLNRDEVLELAASKIVDDYANQDGLYDKIRKEISSRLDKLFKERVDSLLDQLLSDKLEEVMRTTITPVDIFGDKVGEPTTIRESLTEKAKEFWNTQVTEDGKVPKESNYYSSRKLKTRAEYMLGKVISETFADEVKANATAILKDFKENLRTDLHKNIDRHLDNIVNTSKKRH